MSKYFAGEHTPQEILERPDWAKGAELSAEARDASPAGRPKDYKWARSLGVPYTHELFRLMLDLARNAEDERVKLMAITALWDRTWGKPPQAQPDGAVDPRRAAADPEALRGRLVAVLAEVVPAQGAGQVGGVVDALPARRPAGG